MATVKSRTRTTHTVTHTVNDVDHEFEVVFMPYNSDTVQVKISKDGKRAVVGYLCQDDDPSNPRKEFDQIDHMICFHSRYTLGDEHEYESPDGLMFVLAGEVDPGFWDFKERLSNELWDSLGSTYDEREKEQNRRLYARMNKALEKGYVTMPLYLLDHSGISISTRDFGDPWDSGRVGIIYMSREEILDNWGGKILTKKLRQQAKDSMKGSVEEFDQYLTGDVYGVCTQKFVNVADEGDDPEWEAWKHRGLIGYSGPGGGTPIHGDEGRAECWGFYGHKYATEELTSWMENEQEWLDTPLPNEDEDPDQLKLLEVA